MLPRLHLIRPGTPLEVVVLIVVNLVGACARLLAAAFPLNEAAPTRLHAVMAVVSLAMAVTLRVSGPRTPRWWLHGNVALAVLLAGVMVATSVTTAGAMLVGFSYAWLGTYVAVFFSPRAARAHAALITVTFGVCLLVANIPGSFVAWPIVTASVWVAALLLADLNMRLRTQADHDALTGLLNRNGFIRAAERERAIAARTGQWPTLALIDLDDFKMVNDGGGHAAGDRLLAELSQVWRGALRPGDLLSRYGGDEFAVLLPATSAGDAELVLRRLSEVHDVRWTYGLQTWFPAETLDDTIARADSLLYREKAARRVTTTPDVEPTSVAGFAGA